MLEALAHHFFGVCLVHIYYSGQQSRLTARSVASTARTALPPSLTHNTPPAPSAVTGRSCEASHTSPRSCLTSKWMMPISPHHVLPFTALFQALAPSQINIFFRQYRVFMPDDVVHLTVCYFGEAISTTPPSCIVLSTPRTWQLGEREALAHQFFRVNLGWNSAHITISGSTRPADG